MTFIYIFIYFFQEHTVRFALNLLSPPPPVDYSGSDSHLTGHGPVLYVVLAGISSVDCAQVFSYHGLVSINSMCILTYFSSMLFTHGRHKFFCVFISMFLGSRTSGCTNGTI